MRRNGCASLPVDKPWHRCALCRAATEARAAHPQDPSQYVGMRGASIFFIKTTVSSECCEDVLGVRDDDDMM